MIVLCAPLAARVGAWFDSWEDQGERPRLMAQLARVVGVLAMMGSATALLVGRTYNPFIYYRF